MLLIPYLPTRGTRTYISAACDATWPPADACGPHTPAGCRRSMSCCRPHCLPTPRDGFDNSSGDYHLISIGGIIHNCNSLISRRHNVMHPIVLAAFRVASPLRVVSVLAIA